jgi:hypothetical protein
MLSNDWLKNKGLELMLSNDWLKNEGLELMLSNDWFKMWGWKQGCQVIGEKVRAGTNIVDSLCNLPMISTSSAYWKCSSAISKVL